MVVPTHMDENLPVTEFVQGEEFFQGEELPNHLSGDNQLIKEQQSTESPFSYRSTTLEYFWVNMDSRGENITNREDTN